MAVRIRLARMGKKKKPSYRIVVVDSKKPRYTEFIDEIGYYDPLRNELQTRIDLEKLKEWMKRGAELTPAVSRLLKTIQREIPQTEVNNG
jgi:small subunit ribosomal protein S16